jgi:hypothetical protein
MTWAEVADTALKLGVPSVIAAAIAAGVAIFLSRRSRAHEFERERRRRKQDCLERAIEDFDECDLAMDEYYVLTQTAAAFRDNPNLSLQLETAQNQVASAGKTEAAELKLLRSRSKLSVFGFKKASEALEAYSFAVSKERVALRPMRNGEPGWEGPLAAAHEERMTKAFEFREAIGAAYDQL